jgi:hypothetical protein
MMLLTRIAQFGEPEAAVEILSRHVEHVEGCIMALSHTAAYNICRLDWLLQAARKVEEDEGKRGAYVAEAKEVMERATRSVRGLQPHDWTDLVSYLAMLLETRATWCVSDATPSTCCSWLLGAHTFS